MNSGGRQGLEKRRLELQVSFSSFFSLLLILTFFIKRYSLLRTTATTLHQTTAAGNVGQGRATEEGDNIGRGSSPETSNHHFSFA